MKSKRFFALVMLLALMICSALPAGAENVAPVLTDCVSYIVMEPTTGQVLIEKNADTVLYPASITKIMILGLACEKAQNNWDTVVTVGDEEINSLEFKAAHIALRPGENVRLEDMLYATCMQSACDAANVLAVYVGEDGTIQSGVDAMNAKAQELGLTNTHFANPTGLHDESLYSTAREMALVTQWAFQQPGFLDVFCRTRTWIMEPTNIQENSRYFYCDDHLRLGGYKIFRPYAKGSKSGWHDEALYTQVTYAEQDGVELICVTMKSSTRDTKYTDIAGLFDYCFENFQHRSVPVAATGTGIPVWGGSGKLGKINLSSPDSVDILAANNLSVDELETEMNIPEKYVLGMAFKPTMTITLHGGGKQADSRFMVPMRVSGLDALLGANTYARAFSPTEHRQMGVGLALLVVILVALVILLRTKRDKRRTPPQKNVLQHRQDSVAAAPRPIRRANYQNQTNHTARPGNYRGRDGYSSRGYNNMPHNSRR